MNESEQYLTPPQIARRLRISPDKVLTWIRAGELRAVNVASEGAQRPLWRVAEADLTAFLEGRTNPAPRPTEPRRRRREKPDDFVKYF